MMKRAEKPRRPSACQQDMAAHGSPFFGDGDCSGFRLFPAPEIISNPARSRTEHDEQRCDADRQCQSADCIYD